eukprot:5102033-Prymnesium_polylepis.1
MLPALPIHEVDPAWPTSRAGGTALELADISGLHVDVDDSVWVIQRYANALNTLGLPPVLRFSAAGDLISSWGGQSDAYDWPENEHGVYVDHMGCVWVCGGLPYEKATGDERFPAPELVHDRMVLKFSSNGTLLLQLGRPFTGGGNADAHNFNRPSEVVVDPATDEVFVADGYGNQRVVALDAATGAFRRQWGGYGHAPVDGSGDTTTQFGRTVHGIALAERGRE